MSKDIVKLDPQEYGLEESRAKEIAAQFQPMLDKMKELEDQYNEVLKLPEDDPETAKKAKRVRLEYVKVRTGTEKIHKKQKAFFLAGGRFVDGWKNTQKFASQGIEEKLKEIETYHERKEAERKERLRQERWEKLSNYMEEEPNGLGNMEESVFENLLSGAKTAHEQKVEAERKAEEERQERERLDKLEQKRKIEIAPYLQFANETPQVRELSEAGYSDLLGKLKKAKAKHDAEQEKIRKENERLRKEAEAERKRQEKIEAERKAKEEKERREREERQRKEREAHEEALRKEREERERVEAEIEARRKEEEAERKRQAEAKRKAELAPDKDKLRSVVDQLVSIQMPSVKDEDAKEIEKEVEARLQEVISYIETEVEKL